jgi:S-(hydroxymethyl)glutathione dehydrogenase/alcohol dehydrogenase
VSGIEQPITVDMQLFEWDKRYINPLYGECRPARDSAEGLRQSNAVLAIAEQTQARCHHANGRNVGVMGRHTERPGSAERR